MPTNSYTLDEYQQDAARTIPDGLPAADRLHHAVLMCAAEAGEVAGLLQKTYQGHPLPTAALRKEGGDLLWAVAYLFSALEIPLSEVAAENIDKLRTRYPERFSAADSLARVDASSGTDPAHP